MFGTDNMAPWHHGTVPFRLGLDRRRSQMVVPGQSAKSAEYRNRRPGSAETWVNWYNVRPPNVM